jgi:hypothetical protein
MEGYVMKKARPANIRSLLLSALILSSCAFRSLACYHPDTGRWLSRDPIGEKGGIKLYSFCRNAATLWIDPLGEDVKNNSGCPGVVKSGDDNVTSVQEIQK